MNDLPHESGLTKPVPGRLCGTCTLCCKVMAITSLQKAKGTWCSHCSPGQGCQIYSERPDECRRFSCLWLVNPELGPEWKPDRSRMVITVSNEGRQLELRCDPGYPDAWRRQPYYRKIHEWALSARSHDGSIIVSVGKQLTLVAPEGEFPLGEVHDDDRIAYELPGSQLADVRVIKPHQRQGEDEGMI